MVNKLNLRYGASSGNDKFSPAPIEIILARLNDYEDISLCPPQLIVCLRLLLRTVPYATIRTPDHLAEQCGIQTVSVYEQYPNLADKNLLPPERSGISPPELVHLCRCRIRQCLFDNWALPHGIQTLQIPKSLKDYLDLMTD